MLDSDRSGIQSAAVPFDHRKVCREVAWARGVHRCWLLLKRHRSCKGSVSAAIPLPLPSPLPLFYPVRRYYCWFFKGMTKTLTCRLVARLHSTWSSLEREGICGSSKGKLRVRANNRSPIPLHLYEISGSFLGAISDLAINSHKSLACTRSNSLRSLKCVTLSIVKH